jgi:hypothetical protein
MLNCRQIAAIEQFLEISYETDGSLTAPGHNSNFISLFGEI